MRVKAEHGKADLKLGIKNTKIMASSPITSWQIDGGRIGSSDRFYSGVAPESLQTVTAARKVKDASSLEGKL